MIMKRPAAAVLALALLAGCTFSGGNGQPAAPAGGPSPTAGPTPINTSTAEGVASAFLDAWQAGDYATMYSLLDPAAAAEITQEAFTQKYTDVAALMTEQSVNITVDMTRLVSAGANARLPIRVAYGTIALGDVTKDLSVNLRQTGDRWGITWDPTMILPELVGGNTLSLQIDSPARANIYDRNGLWLVQSETPTVTISVTPSLVGDEEDEARLLGDLSRLLRVSPQVIKQQYSGYAPDYDQPIAVGDADQENIDNNFRDIYTYQALRFDSKLNRRDFAVLAPHVVGYTSFIPAEQVDAYKARGYAGDELVGLAGLEAWGEQYLAGTRGGSLIAIAPDDSIYGEVASRESAPALNLYTTLDRNLQFIVQEAIEDAYSFAQPTWAPTANGAAVIAMDVNTGEIRAMASYPNYDPNILYPRNGNPLLTDSYINSLLNDPRKPFFNRATSSAQPPGSIFKMITMAAGLGSGLFSPDSEYTCTGVWEELGRRLDWKEEGHGTLTFVQGLTGSCDPWFYHVGFTTGKQDPNLIPTYARGFGLGKPTGIELDEDPGLVPDPAWLQQTRGDTWTLDDSVNIAIGQGDMLTTPIQMVTAVAAIANGGTLYQPHLVGSIGISRDQPTVTFGPVPAGTLPIAGEQLRAIQEGMWGVTSIIDLGTAEGRLGSMQIATAGKTGTAQVSLPGAQPIAWFVGYVPYEEPELAIIVMVENGGQGSTVASPIFRRIVERWYDLRVFRYPDDWADPDLYEFVKEIGE